MCQILVFVEAKSTSPGAYLPGDVIVVVDDTHEFSPLEIAHPRFRIVRIPGLAASAVAQLSLSASGIRRLLALPEAGIALLRGGSGVIDIDPRTAFDLLCSPVSRVEIE